MPTFDEIYNDLNTVVNETLKKIEECFKDEPENNIIEGLLKEVSDLKKKIKNKKFQIIIFAMMKSGKSSFLNALMRNDYLPMNSIEETAVAVNINHVIFKNGNKAILSDKGEIIAYDEDINKTISIYNKKIRDGEKNNCKLELSTSISEIKKRFDKSDIKFEIIDTPGFGTENKELSSISDNLIKEAGVIIYLLDYTKLGMDDESKLFDNITKIRPDLVNNNHDKIHERLFFVVNKFDIRTANGRTKEQTTEYLIEKLSDYIPNIDKKNFIYLSSHYALISQQILKKDVSFEIRNSFAKIAFGEVGMYDATIEDCIEKSDMILEKSGIKEIEEKILKYIYENRAKIFVQDVLRELKDIVNNFDNKVVTMGLNTLQNQKQRILELDKDIVNVKKRFSDIKNVNKSDYIIKKNWFSEQFLKYQENLKKYVENQIESKGVTISKENDLYTIIENIHKGLQSRFNSYKDEQINSTIKIQHELFSNLQVKFNELSTEFHKKLKDISSDFSIVNLDFTNIDYGEAISINKAQIDRLVKKRTDKVNVDEDYYEDESFCCSFSNKWVKKTRTVITERISFEIHKNDFKNFFNDEIEIRIQKAIEKYYEITTKEADEKIDINVKNYEKYVQDYADTIQIELKNINEKGKDYVEKRIEVLNNYKQFINRIRKQISILE